MPRKIRVLVVDDSPLVRQILTQGLARDPGIEVIGSSADAYLARDMIIQQNPDVLTLDVEMPRMDGLTFLKRLIPQHPMPVVMVSSLTERGKKITLDCLDAGAVDFVHKPSSTQPGGMEGMLLELRAKIKIAAGARVRTPSRIQPAQTGPAQAPPTVPIAPHQAKKLIAIGASTGGTEAIKEVITNFPAAMPGVVIVQHMPPGFTKIFADRLNQLCAMEVKEAEDGDKVRPGLILVAPGGKQMRVERKDIGYQVSCQAGPNVSGHCPSVDVLMHSVATAAGAEAAGIILTGMGADGADGMLAMRKAGARTLAQDETTSVVFGMPRVAYERGGAERLLPLNRIASTVINLFRGGL